jgi:hypothetical protein
VHRLNDRLRRLPFRVKLTLIFVGVMAALLAGISLFQYLYFRSNLDASINQALRARASEIVGVVRLGQPIATVATRALGDRGVRAGPRPPRADHRR